MKIILAIVVIIAIIVIRALVVGAFYPEFSDIDNILSLIYAASYGIQGIVTAYIIYRFFK